MDALYEMYGRCLRYEKDLRLPRAYRYGLSPSKALRQVENYLGIALAHNDAV